MFRELCTEQRYNEVRGPLKRRSVNMIRDYLSQVQRKSPGRRRYDDELRAIPAVQDAVITLFAMGFKPDMIVLFVSREELDQLSILLIMTSYTTRSINELLKGAMND